MRSFRRVAAVAAIMAFSSIAAARSKAPTADDVKAAAEAFDRGRQAFKEENFVEAADNFEAADDRAPSAAALKLAIRSRDQAGQLHRAATLAALAQQRHPDDAELVELADEVLGRAQGKLYQINVSCSSSCGLLLDGKIVPGGSAKRRKLYVDPDATYTLTATWSKGRSQEREITASAGEEGDFDFEAPAIEAEPEPESTEANTSLYDEEPRPADEPANEKTSSGGLSPSVFWVGAGLTVLGGAVTAWSGVDTQNNPGPDKVRAECSSNSSECERLYQNGIDRQNRTNLLLGITAGLGLTTIIVGLAATDWGSSPTRTSARLRRQVAKAPAFTPWVSVGVGTDASLSWKNGAQVGAVGRF